MTASRVKQQTGADVYLAVAKLLQLLGDDGAGLLDESTLAGLPVELAYVADFTTQERDDLSSTLFTARAVGTMVVRACQGEEVILLEADPARGLAVRLHAVLSPTLEEMLNQFNDCMAAVILSRICERLPVNAPGAQLTGQQSNVRYVNFR